MNIVWLHRVPESVSGTLRGSPDHTLRTAVLGAFCGPYLNHLLPRGNKYHEFYIDNFLIFLFDVNTNLLSLKPPFCLVFLFLNTHTNILLLIAIFM